MTEELRDFARMIDHSLLHPTLTDRELADGCRLARRLDVALRARYRTTETRRARRP